MPTKVPLAAPSATVLVVALLSVGTVGLTLVTKMLPHGSRGAPGTGPFSEITRHNFNQVPREWEIADQLGWAETLDAEYVALTQLQADALVTLDAELVRRVEGIVPTASLDAVRTA